MEEGKSAVNSHQDQLLKDEVEDIKNRYATLKLTL